ncbi:integral membrane protein GPR137 [Neosynchiropus ocellatus]
MEEDPRNATLAPTAATLPPPVPLRPAVAPHVQLGFTILYTSLYSALLLVVYAQLWLLYIYRHKRCSYQSVFLFLCLLWAALRTTLFSFYFHNSLEANHLPVAAYWVLYCFPVCLQFFTFSLINLYFTQVLLKARGTCSAEATRHMWLARGIYGVMCAIFFSVNLVCAILGERDRKGSGDQTWNLVLIRVLVNDLLFILDAVLLASLLLLLTRHSRATSLYLTSRGTTVWRTAALGAAVILLFTSRACYNLTVLFMSLNIHVEAFDFNWYNVSDQADLHSDLGDCGFLVFGAILFIWELLPTSLLILIFRVRQPQQEGGHANGSNRVLPRPYFFDDPQGSEEDIAIPRSHMSHPHLSWYGAETAPLLFASSQSPVRHQHHSLYSTPQY